MATNNSRWNNNKVTHSLLVHVVVLHQTARGETDRHKKRGRRRLLAASHSSKTCQYLLWVAGALPEPAVCCLVTLSANCLNAARCQWAAVAANLGPVRQRALIWRPLSPHQNVWMHRLRTSRRLCNNVHSHSNKSRRLRCRGRADATRCS